jgi:formamidopyrimidine-DNA glycosylase
VPELPEVEQYRRLAEGALDRTVQTVSTPDLWFLKAGTDPEALRVTLEGATFTAARRIGKLLLLDTSEGTPLGIRFGMTGTLVVDDLAGVDELLYAPHRHRPEWNRFAVQFADGGSMAVQDPRRLGGVTLDPVLTGLGPDAATITLGQLATALNSTAPLKARLLDQARVAGVGNLMADEILWRAGLSPQRTSGGLSTVEIRRLHRNLRRTIDLLIGRGGSHLGDLMDQRHVGGRCPRDGHELVRATVGGRTSYWCPVHQV